jgi:hypothetical protein
MFRSLSLFGGSRQQRRMTFLVLETVYLCRLCVGTGKRPNFGNGPFDNIFTGIKDIHIGLKSR